MLRFNGSIRLLGVIPPMNPSEGYRQNLTTLGLLLDLGPVHEG